MRDLMIIASGALSTAFALSAVASDGAPDPTFGSGGKVTIAAATLGFSSNLVAADVAVQADGSTIVAGSDGQNDCFVTRLDVGGVVDTTFGGTNGLPPGFAGYAACTITSIALRPDGRIVAAAMDSSGMRSGIVQFTRDGLPDGTFGGGGARILDPVASGDGVYPQRLLVDADGTIAVAGFYHQQVSNDNQFMFVRLSADGLSVAPLFLYSFGSGPNQDDHALDLAIDSQDRYVLGGYHRGAAGNYDCGAIRIRHDLFDVDTTFGSAGQAIVAFDQGGDNGDFCNAIAVVPQNDYVVLGGHATTSIGTGTYQAAVLVFLDSNGRLVDYGCAAVCQAAKFSFAYDRSAAAGTTNDIAKLIIDNHDVQFPQVLAIGSGFQPGVPYGPQVGVARVNLPYNTNFFLDPGFGNNGTMGLWFAERPDGLGLFRTNNTGMSGTVAGGKLVIAGSTAASGGNAAAIARTAPFDEIFTSRFEKNYYSP